MTPTVICMSVSSARNCSSFSIRSSRPAGSPENRSKESRLVGVEAEVAETWMSPHPFVVDPPATFPGIGHRRTGKGKRPAVAGEGDLDLVRIVKVPGRLERGGQRGHLERALDQLSKQPDLSPGNKRFVRLDIDDVLGADLPVRLGDPVRSARMVGSRHDRPKPARLDAPAQKLVIHRKIERKVRNLRGDPLGDPKEQRLSRMRCKSLRGKRVDSSRQGTMIATRLMLLHPGSGLLGCKPARPGGFFRPLHLTAERPAPFHG